MGVGSHRFLLENSLRILQFIKGTLSKQNYDVVKATQPKSKILIFVSSTFTDTSLERNRLQERILPKMQALTDPYQIQYLFYDMRFGVKDSNTIDHLTWIVCRDAIEECHKSSDGLFFLSLQGEKYGTRPIPKYLDKTLIDELLTTAHESLAHLIDLFHAWYQLDENHVPPRYELRPSRSVDDSKFSESSDHLRDTLLNNLIFERFPVHGGRTDDDGEEFEELLINRSVTEWETSFALSIDPKRCFWAQRTLHLESLKQTAQEYSDKFIDTLHNSSLALKLKSLKGKMMCTLQPVNRIHSFYNHLDVQAYNDEGINLKRDRYLDEWEESMTSILQDDLDQALFKRDQWREELSTLSFGLSIQEDIEEILHHQKLAYEKGKNFIGREDLLTKVLDLFDKPWNSSEQLTKSLHCITFAIIGKSGTGKTSLISKLALILSERKSSLQSKRLDLSIPLIIRYCGTSTCSIHGIDLMQSIIIQILLSYQRESEVSSFITHKPVLTYDETVHIFHNTLQEYPVYLLIDSLDQLSNQHEERSQLSFLKNLSSFHRLSRLIVTTLPDEYDYTSRQWKYFYSIEKRVRENKVPRVHVDLISHSPDARKDRMLSLPEEAFALRETIYKLTEELLARRTRTLTPAQMNLVVHSAMQEPTILYLTLAIEIVSQWKSTDNLEILHLKPTVYGIMEQIFGELERTYGKQFTRTAFAIITFAKEGITDLEMEDLLSLDEDVLNEVFQYSSLTKFPIHVWLRLKTAIQHLIIERENHAVQWYHRQLLETATVRYHEEKEKVHRMMGKYFSNRISDFIREEKKIRQQPLFLPHRDPARKKNNLNIWLERSDEIRPIINRRHVIEGIFQLLSAKMYEECIEEICDFEMIYASVILGEGFSLVQYCDTVNQVYYHKTELNQDYVERITHYYRWLRKEMTRIVENPRDNIPLTAQAEPECSLVYHQIQQFIANQNMSQQQQPPPSPPGCMVTLPRHLLSPSSRAGSPFEFDEEVGTSKENLPWSPCQHGSDVMSPKNFDSLFMNFLGHKDSVLSFDWNHNGSQIVSVSEDAVIIVWDAVTGEKKNSLLPRKGRVNQIRWNPDHSNRIAFTENNIIRLWNAVTSEFLGDLHEHTATVTALCWSLNGLQLATGSADNTIILWDTSDITLSSKYNIIKKLKGHKNNVTSIAWNPQNSNILASGSQDKTIKIWNLTKGKVQRTLTGHTSWITNIEWSPRGDQLLSASYDTTIRLWDGNTGKLIETFTGHKNWVTSISWNYGGTMIVSGSADRTVKVWNIETGEVLSTFVNHQDRITCVSWNTVNEDRIMSGSQDGSIKLWDVTTLNDMFGPTRRPSDDSQG